ncbi:MAG: ABC transporter ATP-binding protein [Candidatus Neptunochlamydia sp.]|nr:ABC transporter ATP-binding protein [Candidatus Neptunochlamydia sp.]
MIILEAKNLKKVFISPGKYEILKGVSLTVHEGETIAIMGPSGVGKSTLLHILGTLDTPSEGTLEIAGKNALSAQAATLRNQHIGFVFQNYNLLDEYSVIDNVLMPTRIARISGKGNLAKKLLQDVGLKDHMHHLAKQLSGGEKQRAAIARALCNNPDLILADEPTGNLDDANSARIHELLISSAKTLDKGLIVVSHNHELAKQCDVVYTLHDGYLEKL